MIDRSNECLLIDAMFGELLRTLERWTEATKVLAEVVLSNPFQSDDRNLAAQAAQQRVSFGRRKLRNEGKKQASTGRRSECVIQTEPVVVFSWLWQMTDISCVLFKACVESCYRNRIEQFASYRSRRHPRELFQQLSWCHIFPYVSAQMSC